MDSPQWITDARAVLFVPGDRPDRFPTAARSGADGIVLDLEDGVGADAKATSRTHTTTWLRNAERAAVRVNGAGTPWQAEDLDQLARTGRPVVAMVPKAESATDVHAVRQALPQGSVVVPIIESALGVRRVAEICAAPGVARLAFGNGDLGRDLGVDPADHQALHYARSVVVVESRAHGLAQPLDGVTLGIGDEDALRRDSRHAVAMGFGGRLCIHPRQVAAVHAAFRPTAAEVRWAERVVASADTAAASVVDGQFVDKPVVERAHQIVARSQPREGGTR